MRRAAQILLIVAMAAFSTRAAPQGLMPSFPQVKVDRVNAADPSGWSLQVTALNQDGESEELLRHKVSVFLKEGSDPIMPAGLEPIVRFDSGLPEPGFDGRMKSIRKADIRQAAIIVMAAHADITRQVGQAMKEALDAVLNGLREDARVGVVFYGDKVMVIWSPDGTRVELRDVNEYQHCLGRLRSEAMGRPYDGPQGAVGCGGLFSSPSQVTGGLKTLPAGQGLFPRLFGIPEAAAVMEAARLRGHSPLDMRSGEAVGDLFATGGLEAAVRMLAAATDPSTSREIILISDGRDGYLRFADVESDRASRSRSCVARAKECSARTGRAGLDHEGGSRACTRQVLDCAIPKVAGALRVREEAVRDYMAALIRKLRLFDIRLSVIALPGTGDVGLARLKILALKGRGTFRSAGTIGGLVPVAATPLAEELATQVVIHPDRGLTPNTAYSVAVSVDDDIYSGAYRFTTGESVMFWEGTWRRARSYAIRKLGHAWGPVVLWIAAVLAALLAVWLSWKMGKGIVGLIKKIGGGKARSGLKDQPRPRVPGLKRPG
ncbi:MAG: hypothetical protein GXP54_11510 [Deltaproteobacteria bacterium]|nr:hypothetical protein [Deltaproteobacteria bacterium]